MTVTEGLTPLPKGCCDGCNKVRNTLYAVADNPWDGEIEVVWCYFCLKENERHCLKALAEGEQLMQRMWQEPHPGGPLPKATTPEEIR